MTSIKFGSKTPYLYLSSGTSIHTYDLRADGIILTEPINTYNFSQEEINDVSKELNEKKKNATIYRVIIKRRRLM